MPKVDDEVIARLKAEMDSLQGALIKGGGTSGAASAKDGRNAFERLVKLAGFSELCQANARKRLEKEGYGQEAVEAGVAKAVDYGIIDDARYAEMLIGKRLRAGRGRYGIGVELEGLGIDAGELLFPYGDSACQDEEVDRAIAVLDKKPPTAKNKRESAYSRLLAKGYGNGVAHTAARLWCEAHT